MVGECDSDVHLRGAVERRVSAGPKAFGRNSNQGAVSSCEEMTVIQMAASDSCDMGPPAALV